MFQKIKRKIKNFSSSFYKPKGWEERGLTGVELAIVAGVVITILGAGAVGVYAFRWEIMGWFLRSILIILVTLSKWAAGFSATIFETVASSDLLRTPITKDIIVIHGWKIVRDFSNMFIVLGFVVVGIATILRIREYEAQKALLSLILVALLINFSLVISGIIIDATNITMDYFIYKSGPTGITQPLIAMVNHPDVEKNISALEKKAKGNTFSQGWEDFIVYCLTIAAFAGISAVIFFLYSFLFLFRHVALMCLAILSPLIFVCYAFEATKGIYKSLRNQFLQWAIIGIPAAFFVYLAGHIIAADSFSGVKPDLGANLACLIPIGFLLFAYTLCFQGGAFGTGAAIGLATGVGKSAWGATKMVGKGVWKGSKAALKSETATRIGEAMHILPMGTLEQRRAAGLKEPRERLSRVSSDRLADEITRGRAVTGRKEQTAAFEQLALRGETNRINAADRERLYNDAVRRGVSRETLERGDYRLPEYNNEEVRRVQAARALTPAQARQEIRQQQLLENLPQMDEARLRNIDQPDLTPETVMRFSSYQIRAFQTSDVAQRAHFRNMAAGGIRRNIVDAGAAAVARKNDREAQRLEQLRIAIDTLP